MSAKLTQAWRERALKAEDQVEQLTREREELFRERNAAWAERVLLLRRAEWAEETLRIARAAVELMAVPEHQEKPGPEQPPTTDRQKLVMAQSMIAKLLLVGSAPRS
jgi:hypothetical protein